MRLMLDDFGTGYSSLKHVKRFPIEAIKVDREFCAGVVEDEGDRHILRAIISMASAMDVAVVAEGVESLEQARWLHHLGIGLVQGYAFGRPAPAAAMETLLRDGLPLDRLALAFEPLSDEPSVVPVAPRGLPAPAPAAAGVATVTLGEAAEALRVSTSTVRRWADTGRIQVVRTSGGHRRFPASELRRLNAEAATRPRCARSRSPPRRSPPCTSCSAAPPASSPPPSRAASTTVPLRAGSPPPRGASSSSPGRWRWPVRAAPRTRRARSTRRAGSSRTPTSRARRCWSATRSSSVSATPPCARCRSAGRRAPSSSAPAACSAACARSPSRRPTHEPPPEADHARGRSRSSRSRMRFAAASPLTFACRYAYVASPRRRPQRVVS